MWQALSRVVEKIHLKKIMAKKSQHDSNFINLFDQTADSKQAHKHVEQQSQQQIEASLLDDLFSKFESYMKS